jgi:hypothetical protein
MKFIIFSFVCSCSIGKEPTCLEMLKIIEAVKERIPEQKELNQEIGK